eukprot:4892751-Heterocapsa_arctica.AAC.1
MNAAAALPHSRAAWAIRAGVSTTCLPPHLRWVRDWPRLSALWAATAMATRASPWHGWPCSQSQTSTRP